MHRGRVSGSATASGLGGHGTTHFLVNHRGTQSVVQRQLERLLWHDADELGRKAAVQGERALQHSVISVMLSRRGCGTEQSGPAVQGNKYDAEWGGCGTEQSGPAVQGNKCDAERGGCGTEQSGPAVSPWLITESWLHYWTLLEAFWSD